MRSQNYPRSEQATVTLDREQFLWSLPPAWNLKICHSEQAR